MSEPARMSRFKLGGIVLLAVALGGIATLALLRRHALASEAARLRAEALAGPRVRTALARSEEGPRVLLLQGDALPYVSTTLFAKVSGFLKEMKVDKGSAVRKGQLLALLESPETGRDLKALKADAENKRRLAGRLAGLGAQGIISAQQVEDAEAQARVAEEKLASQAVLEGYQRVVAPFDGVITQRFADPGALIQNGGVSSNAQPLLSLAQVDRLRVSFYLDQQAASLVKAGQEVEALAPQGGEPRRARVSRVAGALDPRTRTLLVEADLDNRDGAFVAGSSVQVKLLVPQRGARILVPQQAVSMRNEQAWAVLVGPEGRVRLRSLVLGEEEAGAVRVLQGLQPGDTVVLSPGVALKDGDKVRVEEGKR